MMYLNWLKNLGGNEDFLNVQENGHHPIIENIIGMYIFFYYSKKCNFRFIHYVKNFSSWIHKMIDSICPQATLSIIRSDFNLIEQLLPHFFIHRHIHQKVIQTSNWIFVKKQSYYHGSEFIKNVILFWFWNLSEL